MYRAKVAYACPAAAAIIVVSTFGEVVAVNAAEPLTPVVVRESTRAFDVSVKRRYGREELVEGPLTSDAVTETESVAAVPAKNPIVTNAPVEV
jgi:hypothetical protein